VRASVTIHFDDDDDTLETRVVCSRRLITRGVDDSPFSSTTEPDSEETDFSDKKLRIRDEDSEEEYSDEEDSGAGSAAGSDKDSNEDSEEDSDDERLYIRWLCRN